jgi:hypothetical protein
LPGDFNHREARGDCKSHVGETVLACDHGVSTEICEAIHTPAMAPALTTTHENAADSILVVQARHLGTLPRKVPEASARLTRIAATFDPSLHEDSSIISVKSRRRIANGQVDRVRVFVVRRDRRLVPFDGRSITNRIESIRKANSYVIKS